MVMGTPYLPVNDGFVLCQSEHPGIDGYTWLWELPVNDGFVLR